MLEEKVLKTMEKYKLIEKDDKIIIAVSGGPDSMCLLNLLNSFKEKLNIELFVAHVNHMIREEADSETLYVQNYCKKNNIQCFIKKIDVTKLAKEKKNGTEEMGRIVRYNFFEEVANRISANKIAIAHTLNDNAETILMNLMRGSSLEGLKGIEPKRDKYIRPIIECSREEIEKYCDEKKLEPKFDKSNNDNTYTRNKIRNLLIPYLKEEFNPNIIYTLNRMAELVRQDVDYFNNIVKKEYNNIVLEEKENIVLDLRKFNNLEKVIKSRLLLYTINKLIGTTQGIEKINIEDMIKLCENNIGNKYLIPNTKIKIYVKKGKIFIYKL